ncbi:hypothetical protein FRAHR75_1070006 [Frankia sp. Hr75.2]|nr:hypothetical protein FRAHR75_1070006 [Frankia sp. Hr75.2]
MGRLGRAGLTDHMTTHLTTHPATPVTTTVISGACPARGAADRGRVTR